MKNWITSWFVCLALSVVACEQKGGVDQSSAIEVTDYSGNRISLKKPAKRIIALAPNTVENAYSAGAGESLVGVMEYSNYPPKALSLPVVGSFQSMNIERILELEPDLILAWQSGNSSAAIGRLRDLGLPVYLDEPQSLSDIAKSIRDIGELAGTQEAANVAAIKFENQVEDIREKYLSAEPVSVFYEVWNRPLQTINGSHIISAAMKICGGRNIFEHEIAVAPIVNIESVLERDPQAIIAGGTGEGRPLWLDEWLQWPNLTATKNQHLFHVNPDHTQRHTIRLLLGIEAMCAHFEKVRARLDVSKSN